MKIGILTFHRAYNYGAVLQCYALKSVLSNMGHDAYVIDYRQPAIEDVYKFKSIFSKKRFFSLNPIKYIPYIGICMIRDVKRLIERRKKQIIFEGFQREHLNLLQTDNGKIPADLDAYVIGSDMLWAEECLNGNFEPVYLGEFKRNESSKVVGYAISGTPASFIKLGNLRKFDFVENFTSISVREKSLADIANQYTSVPVSQCIDPTLLTTKDRWVELLDRKWAKKKYIVSYYLRNVPRELQLKVVELAKRDGYEIINIDVYSGNPVTVEEFVSIIAYASYIITDSFHGIIFSMIFERPFHAIKLNDPHDARYVDVLYKLGLNANAVDTQFEPFIPEIDYTLIADRIVEFRKDSIEFLINGIENDTQNNQNSISQ